MSSGWSSLHSSLVDRLSPGLMSLRWSVLADSGWQRSGGRCQLDPCYRDTIRAWPVHWRRRMSQPERRSGVDDYERSDLRPRTVIICAAILLVSLAIVLTAV